MNWRQVDCHECGGAGVVAVYTVGCTDFEGADFCPRCGGSGQLWQSPNGRIADYPGGPFRGSVRSMERLNLGQLAVMP